MEWSTNIFIEKANLIHHDKYDYSKTVYTNMKSKVIIVCPVHGQFEQTPDKHIHGKCGCPSCAGNMQGTFQSFVSKAMIIHGNKYDYTDVIYQNNKTPVKIKCKKHGSFVQAPTNHLKGKGCPCCSGNIPLTNEQFIAHANLIHGNQYDYSKTLYQGNKKPVEIICKKHGLFIQRPDVHFTGAGCPECGKVKQVEHRDCRAAYQKSELTFLKKYGIRNPMYDPDIRQRHKKIMASEIVNVKRTNKHKTNAPFI